MQSVSISHTVATVIEITVNYTYTSVQVPAALAAFTLSIMLLILKFAQKFNIIHLFFKTQ